LAVVGVFSWVTVLELCETNVILLDDILQDKIVDIGWLALASVLACIIHSQVILSTFSCELMSLQTQYFVS
jgi:hypothetical protein